MKLCAQGCTLEHASFSVKSVSHHTHRVYTGGLRRVCGVIGIQKAKALVCNTNTKRMLVLAVDAIRGRRTKGESFPGSVLIAVT